HASPRLVRLFANVSHPCYVNLRNLPSFPTRRSSDLHRGPRASALVELDVAEQPAVLRVRVPEGVEGRALHRADPAEARHEARRQDRKSTRLNSSHVKISYAVFCLKKKIIYEITHRIY